MKTGSVVMKKSFFKICMIAVFVLTLFSFHKLSNVWAKYQSKVTLNEQAKVADFGTLTFLEYKSDGTTLISGTEASIEIVNVKPGENINKKLTVSFVGNEVDVYVFFTIDAEKWILNENNTNRLSIKNDTDDDIVYWELNDKWTYLKTEFISSDVNKYVFYTTVFAFEGLTNDVMTNIHVNSFGFEDVHIFNDNEYSLSFDTFAISKPGATPEMAWEKISG